MVSALEFFSGVGGFAAVARELRVTVAAAYDQDGEACATYKANFGQAPVCRTLDTLDLRSLPNAEMWWMSPPCTPFTRRGAQRDAADPRAVAFLRLIEEIARRKQLGSGAPGIVVVENVTGFLGSQVHRKLWETWTSAGYALAKAVLCPTQFGIPMKRPRVFLVAVAGGQAPVLEAPHPELSRLSLTDFLDPNATEVPALRVPASQLSRYETSLNILDPANPEACAICFTSGYGKSWKAAGSYLRCPDGELRRFAPEEILRLLGFPPDFRFPESVSLQRRWHLAGNSLSLHCVRHVLDRLGLAGQRLAPRLTAASPPEPRPPVSCETL